MIITGIQSLDLYNLTTTTALYGDQTYQLVAVWEDVSMDANFKDVGVGSHYDAMNETVTGLRFEWQGLGEGRNKCSRYVNRIERVKHFPGIRWR